MSEPCEHQRDEAAWIWAQQLRFVADERDAAQAKVARVEALCKDTDGDWLHGESELPVGEFIAAIVPPS